MVTAETEKSNMPSHRVLEKCGLSIFAEMKAAISGVLKKSEKNSKDLNLSDDYPNEIIKAEQRNCPFVLRLSYNEGGMK